MELTAPPSRLAGLTDRGTGGLGAGQVGRGTGGPGTGRTSHGTGGPGTGRTGHGTSADGAWNYGLGITTLTPTPRAVILGQKTRREPEKAESDTEGTGSSGQAGCKITHKP